METSLDPEVDRARQALVEGRYSEAADLAHVARATRSDDPLLAWLEGRALLELERPAEAQAILAEAARLVPASGEVLSTWASSLQELGRSADALQIFLRALEASPRSQEVMVRVADFLCERDEVAAARTLYENACMDGSIDALAGCIHVCVRQGRLDEALGLLGVLPEGFPPVPVLVLAVAELMRARGESEKARTLLKDLLELQIAPRMRARALHDIGAVHESLGEHEAAFEAHTRAHELRGTPYDSSAREAWAARIVERYSTQLFAREASLAPERPGLVVLVGMPRAGRGLVSRILARHPSVALLPDGAGLLAIQESLDIDSHSAMAHAAQAARERLETAAAGRSWLIDREYANHFTLGTAALLLPGTRVVHCRRGLLDTGISSYFHDYHSALGFTQHLDSLAHEWKLYERMMQHWSEHLPLAVLELDYESLVQQPEREIQRLLAFLGLPWNEALAPFVRGESASALHTTSIGRARPYQNRLVPLVHELGLAEGG